MGQIDVDFSVIVGFTTSMSTVIHTTTINYLFCLKRFTSQFHYPVDPE